MAQLALKRLRKTQPSGLGLSITGSSLKYNFPRLAEANLRCIDDPGPILCGNHQAIDQRIDSLAEVEVEERLGGGELYDFAVLVEAVESARAQFIEPLLESVVRKCGIGR